MGDAGFNEPSGLAHTSGEVTQEYTRKLRGAYGEPLEAPSKDRKEKSMSIMGLVSDILKGGKPVNANSAANQGPMTFSTPLREGADAAQRVGGNSSLPPKNSGVPSPQAFVKQRENSVDFLRRSVKPNPVRVPLDGGPLKIPGGQSSTGDSSTHVSQPGNSYIGSGKLEAFPNRTPPSRRAAEMGARSGASGPKPNPTPPAQRQHNVPESNVRGGILASLNSGENEEKALVGGNKNNVAGLRPSVSSSPMMKSLLERLNKSDSKNVWSVMYRGIAISHHPTQEHAKAQADRRIKETGDPRYSIEQHISTTPNYYNPDSGKYEPKKTTKSINEASEILKAVNPWAVCTAKVGRGDSEKFESCVQQVKAQSGIKKSSEGTMSKAYSKALDVLKSMEKSEPDDVDKGAVEGASSGATTPSQPRTGRLATGVDGAASGAGKAAGGTQMLRPTPRERIPLRRSFEFSGSDLENARQMLMGKNYLVKKSVDDLFGRQEARPSVKDFDAEALRRKIAFSQTVWHDAPHLR